MVIVSYDFIENGIMSKFSKFLKKFGRKIQYSVYEIKNSQRILQNILDEIELRYKKRFKGSDSILMFQICEGYRKKVIRYGYAANEEKMVYFTSRNRTRLLFLENKRADLCLPRHWIPAGVYPVL